MRIRIVRIIRIEIELTLQMREIEPVKVVVVPRSKLVPVVREWAGQQVEWESHRKFDTIIADTTHRTDCSERCQEYSSGRSSWPVPQIVKLSRIECGSPLTCSVVRMSDLGMGQAGIRIAKAFGHPLESLRAIRREKGHRMKFVHHRIEFVLCMIFNMASTDWHEHSSVPTPKSRPFVSN